MLRQRVRLYFRKDHDLRLISHRDLVRVFERLFRRASLPLGMSEGFHPKARLSFPDALSLGVIGLREVMEFELSEIIPAEELLPRLRHQAPPGLELLELRLLEPGEKKAQPRRMTYRTFAPPELRDTVRQRIEMLRGQTSYPIVRPGRKQPLELMDSLDGVELDSENVVFHLRPSRQATVRPREVLQALGLENLEDQGHYLIRVQVEI